LGTELKTEANAVRAWSSHEADQQADGHGEERPGHELAQDGGHGRPGGEDRRAQVAVRQVADVVDVLQHDGLVQVDGEEVGRHIARLRGWDAVLLDQLRLVDIGGIARQQTDQEKGDGDDDVDRDHGPDDAHQPALAPQPRQGSPSSRPRRGRRACRRGGHGGIHEAGSFAIARTLHYT